MLPKNIVNFLIVNPWRDGNFSTLKQPYTKRWLFDRILSAIQGSNIIVIHGPRQVGKTTLLFMLMKNLIFENNVHPMDIFYFNAEDPLIQNDFFSNYVNIYKFVKEERKARAYVLIDEAQKIPDIGVFLKNLHDLNDPELKIIVTGSSTLELKQKTHEPLTGRKQVFHLFPLSFKEFVTLKTGATDWKAIERNPELFNEFATYGGYPKIILAQGDYEKKSALNEIYTSYLQKDIKDFLRIEYPDIFNRLLRILADQTGNLFNINEASNTLGINRLTLEKYVRVLEETFVIHRLTPFYRNPRKEITKMPKIYFLDTGLRNYITGDMTIFPNRADIGKVSENHVFTEYFKTLQDIQKLHFWRTQNKTEVDFIYFLNEKQFFPLEVKYGASRKVIPPALRSFIAMYHPAEAVIFSKQGGGGDSLKLGSTQIWETKIQHCGIDHVAATFAYPFHGLLP